MHLTFFIPGNPKALKRHRAVRRRGHVGSYDPSRADKADLVAKCIMLRPARPIEEPVRLQLVLQFPRPKSHYGKAGLKAHAPRFHTSKPDSSNVLKLIEDALNGIFWRDDALICQHQVTKVYSETPGIQITITPAETT